MNRKTFNAVITPEGDLFVALCPETGTVSQGKTHDEALKNLQEATELYIEEFSLPEIGKPTLTTFEIEVV